MRTPSLVAAVVVVAAAVMQPAVAGSPQATPGAGAQPPKPAAAAARTGPPKHMFQAGDIHWGPGPATLPAGVRMAVLEGDPSASSGQFTIRAMMPDGYKVAPHTHPTTEHVTVLSGTLSVGMGTEWHDANLRDMSQGSFFFMDPSMAHYVRTKGPTTIQVHGQSPLVLRYINPADDPSRKKPGTN